MPWYVFSLIAVVTLSFHTICQKWALNLKITEKKFLFYYFIASFFGFLLLNLRNLSDLITGPNIGLYIFWGLVAAGLSMAGNYTEFYGIKRCPNPAYINGIRNASAIVVLFSAFILFNSPLTWLKVLGVVLVVVGLLPIVISKETKPNQEKIDGNWKLAGIGAMLFFSGMVLVVKKMTILGFSASQILLILFFFGTIGFGIINLFGENKVVLPTEKPTSLVIIPVILALIFVFISDLAGFTAIKLAPNPGYAQAILGVDIVLILFLSKLFFLKDAGGNFDALKWLGVFLIAFGIILMVI